VRLFHSTGLVLLILFLASAPAVALSIFDIILLSKKGYADEEIIALIESTDSMFELEAEDLPRMKELQVSEAVIRAMLERVPAEAPGNPPRPDSTFGGSDVGTATLETAMDEPEHAHEEADGEGHEETLEPEGQDHEAEAWRQRSPPGGGAIPTPADQPVSPDFASGRTDLPVVSFYTIPEERSGHHLHLAVTFSGLEVMILRAEGSFPSIQARAAEVVQRLDAAVALGDGSFVAGSDARGPNVVFQSAASGERVTVVEVGAGDAHAYERRSGRQVDRALLAAYWADLLSDFWDVSMGRPPRRTVGLHDGDALGVLHEALKSSVGQAGGLRAAAELMPSSLRHHLERLTAVVPVDYEGPGDWAD